jgi:hypothetical protein
MLDLSPLWVGKNSVLVPEFFCLFAFLLVEKSSLINFYSGGASAEDIPKEELMHLCMKMNKRMQAMESKGKELVRRKATLLTERNKLLELMGTSSSLSILKDPTASTNSRFAPHSSFMYMLRTGTTTTTVA